MADTDQTMLDTSRKRPRMDGPVFPNNPRPGTKRPFHNTPTTPEIDVRKGCTSMSEDELKLTRATDGLEPSPSQPIEDANVRRRQDANRNQDFHVEKRSRTSDWPLRNTITTGEVTCTPRVALRDRYDKLNSASPPLHASAKPRPSKFVEGSMKDRASQKPHPSYVENSKHSWNQVEVTQDLSLSVKKEAQLIGDYVDHIDPPLVPAGRSEAPKASSIFRFGKSVAAAFNPSSWKIWSKQHEEDSNEKRVLRERHEKAEKIYKELKRAGQLGASSYPTRSDAQEKMFTPYKHDSVVNVEQSASWLGSTRGTKSLTVESSMEEKRCGRIFLDPSRTVSATHRESAAPILSAPLETPFSQPPKKTSQANENLNGPQALRRLPSRKDLQKQQKLVKRVSDLESKLDAARRQLAEAIGNPFPEDISQTNRSRFTPAALPSLPSERLLNVHTASVCDHSETDGVFEVGVAFSIGDRKGSHSKNDKIFEPCVNGPTKTSFRTCQTLDGHKTDAGMAEDGLVELPVGSSHQEISVSFTAIKNTAEKRRIGASIHGDGRDHLPNKENDCDDGLEATKPCIPKRGPGRPRKLQKVDPEPNRVNTGPLEVKPSVECYSINSLHDCKAKDSRVLISPSKKGVSLENNSRIKKKDRLPTSSSLLTSFSETTFIGTKPSTGKAAVPHNEKDDSVGVIKSADIPLSLENATDPRKAALANKKVTRPGAELDECFDVNFDQGRPENLKIGVGKGKAKNKQAFEWPADVF